MQSNAKRYIWSFSIFSAGYIIIGFLLLLLPPQQSNSVVCLILGIVAAVMGIVRIALHFAKNDLSRAFRNDIPIGVTMILIGIFFFAKPETILAIFPIIIGFSVIYDSIVKLQHSFDLKRTNFIKWWGVLAAALATAVIGVLLVLELFPADMRHIFWGAALILDGLVNIATIILFAYHLKKAGAIQANGQELANASPPPIVLPNDEN
jgi:uncharacterized membrane protein HdeD (DUF308 family)